MAVDHQAEGAMAAEEVCDYADGGIEKTRVVRLNAYNWGVIVDEMVRMQLEEADNSRGSSNVRERRPEEVESLRGSTRARFMQFIENRRKGAVGHVINVYKVVGYLFYVVWQEDDSVALYSEEELEMLDS